MTDDEIAQDLERVFAELPGMRRCYEEWKRIGVKFLAAEGLPPLTEVQSQRRFHVLLSQTERRVREAQARARIGLAEEALSEAVSGPTQIHIPFHTDSKDRVGASINTVAASPRPKLPLPPPPTPPPGLLPGSVPLP